MQTQANVVENFYKNVLHNSNHATRDAERDATEFDDELIGAAKRARAHRAEEEEDKNNEDSETDEELRPYEQEVLLRAAQAKRQMEQAAGLPDRGMGIEADPALFGVTVGTPVAAGRRRAALTDEQAEELCARYDVRNLPPEEEERLLGELCGLGVLTQAEAASVRESRIPLPGGVIAAEADPERTRRMQPENRDVIDRLLAVNEDQAAAHRAWQLQYRRAPDLAVVEDGQNRAALVRVLEQLVR